MALTEREEIELDALLMAEERDSLGSYPMVKTCPDCGQAWLNGRETTPADIESIVQRHPETIFVQFFITPDHVCK